jgi:hypothetical protein
MEKIVCSLEEWDSILGYYRPNGSSKTWYLKELKKLSRPLMWGDWNLINEQGEFFSHGMLKGSITPMHTNKLNYVPYENIGNQSHIYIINVYSWSFFSDNLEIGFKCISEKYLKDIKEGKSKILMLYLYEGYSGSKGNFDLEIVEKWRIDSNLPENSIYFVTGNYLIEDIIKEKGLKYQGRPIHYFEPWNKYEDNEIVKFKPVDNKFLFLSYNRNPRPQRIQFLLFLLKEKLFDRGLVSLNNLIYPPMPDDNIDDYNYLKNNAPFIIDHRYDLTFNLACNITKEDYERTFISMVTESLVDDDTLFFSEKIWKPIMVGHPFIIYGNQFTLKYLKSLGYRTFDKWIDESYDEIYDRVHRAQKIVSELKKFENKTTEDLMVIRGEMEEVCKFNKEHYNILYNKKYGEDNINKDLENIFIEVWEGINKDKTKKLI